MMERTVQSDTTFYRCPWPEHVTQTREVLVALMDAGMPGSLDITIEVPLTRVSRQNTDDGWVLQVAVPGDDGGDWRSTIESVIDGIGEGS